MYALFMPVRSDNEFADTPAYAMVEVDPNTVEEINRYRNIVAAINAQERMFYGIEFFTNAAEYYADSYVLDECEIDVYTDPYHTDFTEEDEIDTIRSAQTFHGLDLETVIVKSDGFLFECYDGNSRMETNEVSWVEWDNIVHNAQMSWPLHWQGGA